MAGNSAQARPREEERSPREKMEVSVPTTRRQNGASRPAWFEKGQFFLFISSYLSAGDAQRLFFSFFLIVTFTFC